jgi:hypothetical protein
MRTKFIPLTITNDTQVPRRTTITIELDTYGTTDQARQTTQSLISRINPLFSIHSTQILMDAIPIADL